MLVGVLLLLVVLFAFSSDLNLNVYEIVIQHIMYIMLETRIQG